MSKLTTIEKELVKQLYGVWDDYEFVLGVISHLKDDFERQFVLNFIRNVDNATPEQITLLALNVKKATMEDLIADDFSSIKDQMENNK